MLVTSNRRVSEWARLFGHEVQAVAIRDRLLHEAEILTVNGPSWRLSGRGDLLNHRAQNRENGPADSTSPPS
jgi:DNA replication protein DnaC